MHQVKVIRLPSQLNAAEKMPLPRRTFDSDAGFDLQANISEAITIRPGETHLIPTGLMLAIPEGYVGLIFPRSGNGHKRELVLGNGTGVIDAGYRGEVKVSLTNRGDTIARSINPFDRIAQIVFLVDPRLSFREVQSFQATERGVGGFGHSGVGHDDAQADDAQADDAQVDDAQADDAQADEDEAAITVAELIDALEALPSVAKIDLRSSSHVGLLEAMVEASREDGLGRLGRNE